MSHLQFPYHPWDWHICLHEWLNVYGNLVGKYTVRPMNPMTRCWDAPLGRSLFSLRVLKKRAETRR